MNVLHTYIGEFVYKHYNISNTKHVIFPFVSFLTIEHVL